jgi:hypothetical protein
LFLLKVGGYLGDRLASRLAGFRDGKFRFGICLLEIDDELKPIDMVPCSLTK